MAGKAEGEREKARTAKEKRAEKYGIGVKEGKPIAKPSQFADVAESDFGDPVNWAYPASADYARAALGYFNREGQREDGGYTTQEWKIIGERLAERISRHLDADYVYEGGKLAKVEEDAEKSVTLSRKKQSGLAREKQSGTTLKVGRVLSAANAEAIAGALVSLAKVLERAGIDVPGFGTDPTASTGDDEEDDMPQKSGSTVVINAEGMSVTVSQAGRKEASLGEQERRVQAAWYAAIRLRYGMPGESVESCWVREVYEDRLIVEAPEGLFAYSYETNDEGGISFGEPVKVEVEYVPVKGGEGAKTAPLQTMWAVKMLGETASHYQIGGYGMVWGDEEQRDLSPWKNGDGTRGEFFTPETKGLDDLPVKVITWEHDLDADPDGQPFKEAVGLTEKEKNDKVGRWIEAQIDKAKQYASALMELVKEGVIHFSSETADHWREVAENGEIKQWRTAGYSLTTHPMEPRLTDVSALKAAFEAVGLEFDPDDGSPVKVPTGADRDTNSAGGGEPPEGPVSEGKGAVLLALERERSRFIEIA